MSRLRQFLEKSKKKPKATNAEEMPVAEQPSIVVPSSPEAQVKIDQWGVEEDDVLESAVTVPLCHNSDEEDDDIDLPSNKVKGNFEWKRETEKAPAVEVAPKPQPETTGTGIFEILKKKEKKTNILDTENFPAISAESAAPKTSVWDKPDGVIAKPKEMPNLIAAPKAKTTKPQKAAKTEAVAASTEVIEKKDKNVTNPIGKSKMQDLSGNDIWNVVGATTLRWPRVQFDEASSRNRYKELAALLTCA